MFFVIKGTCTVKVRSEASKDPPVIRTLWKGAHFGEIHLLYRCPRSATVTSTNYNTLARLKLDNFKELISDFPEYEICLRNHVIREYGNLKKPEQENTVVERNDKKKDTKTSFRHQIDPKIQFLEKTIKRVDFLKNIDDSVFFDIMFALKPRQFEKDEMVLAEDS